LYSNISSVFDECKKCDHYLICYVETHTGDPQ
jgi:hypothetical protein